MIIYYWVICCIVDIVWCSFGVDFFFFFFILDNFNFIGIKECLGYLLDFGVGVVWFSLIFLFFMWDFGYDVWNYIDVDLFFGNMVDFENLILEVKDKSKIV